MFRAIFCPYSWA